MNAILHSNLIVTFYHITTTYSMRKLTIKTAKLMIALLIPSMFLFSCSEDIVDFNEDLRPPAESIKTPPQD